MNKVYYRIIRYERTWSRRIEFRLQGRDEVLDQSTSSRAIEHIYRGLTEPKAEVRYTHWHIVSIMLCKDPYFSVFGRFWNSTYERQNNNI